MTDFFAQLAARHRGEAEVLRPRVPFRFEPVSPSLAAGQTGAADSGWHGVGPGGPGRGPGGPGRLEEAWADSGAGAELAVAAEQTTAGGPHSAGLGDGRGSMDLSGTGAAPGTVWRTGQGPSRGGPGARVAGSGTAGSALDREAWRYGGAALYGAVGLDGDAALYGTAALDGGAGLAGAGMLAPAVRGALARRQAAAGTAGPGAYGLGADGPGAFGTGDAGTGDAGPGDAGPEDAGPGTVVWAAQIGRWNGRSGDGDDSDEAAAMADGGRSRRARSVLRPERAGDTGRPLSGPGAASAHRPSDQRWTRDHAGGSAGQDSITVQVTIGRVEVRAAPPAAGATAAPRRSAGPSLADYLRHRSRSTGEPS